MAVCFGPNLCDDYWIHGSTLRQPDPVCHVNGVPGGRHAHLEGRPHAPRTSRLVASYIWRPLRGGPSPPEPGRCARRSRPEVPTEVYERPPPQDVQAHEAPDIQVAATAAAGALPEAASRAQSGGRTSGSTPPRDRDGLAVGSTQRPSDAGGRWRSWMT